MINKYIENMKDVCIDLGADIIEPDRNYWLVRTKGGRFFEDFYFKGYIAIGWNKINFSKSDNREEKIILEEMKLKISEDYKDEKIPGKPAGQIYRFIKKMKKGDIVLVPNSDSKFIAFGEILEDDIYSEHIESEDIDVDTLEKDLLYNGNEDLIQASLIEIGCPFEKRRKVKWLKEVDRNELDSNLYGLLNSHGAVSDASKYSYSIDRELSSFYIKGDRAHIVQRVTTTDDVSAMELINFVSNNLNLIDLYNEVFEKNISKNDITMKLNVQSPGPIDLQGSVLAIGAIATIGVFIVGGQAKFKKNKDGDIEGEVSSKGLLEHITNIIQLKNMQPAIDQTKQGLDQSQENLKIQSPIFSQTNNELASTEETLDDNSNK